MEKQIWYRKSTVAFMKRSHCTHLPLKICETLNRACHLVSLFCSHSYCVINHFCEICSLFIETNQPSLFQTVLECAQINLTLFTMLFLAKQHLHDARRWDISYVCVSSPMSLAKCSRHKASPQEPDNFYSTTTCMNGVNVAKTHSFRHLKSGPRFPTGVFSQLYSVG